MHDPDAPLTHGFTHWVLYGIPGDVTSLAEAAGAGHDFVEGVDSIGTGAYLPPGPPPGHGDHHYYYFEFYALDEYLQT